MAEWPDSEALANWIGPDDLSGDRSRFAEIVEGVTDNIRGKLDPDKLPDDGSCPADLRLAVLIQCHRISTRPSSPHGTVSSPGADFATRISKQDPDVVDLYARFMPDPEP